MKKRLQSIFKPALIALIVMMLASCNRVSQENFNKIQNNMSSQEVISILGEPTSSDSVNIAGVSGTASVWKNTKAEITIQFLNDKVIAKSFNKNSSENAR